MHIDPDPPHEPEVLRQSPPRLLHVVDRDVLEDAGDGVESDASARVDVREPHAAPGRERPPAAGNGNRGVEHDPRAYPRRSAPSRRY